MAWLPAEPFDRLKPAHFEHVGATGYSFEDPSSEAGFGPLPWLPRINTENDPNFIFSDSGAYGPAMEDEDGDGIDEVSPAFLHSFFFDWNADGASDYLYGGHWYGFAPLEGGFIPNSSSVPETGLLSSSHDLGGGEDRILRPFPAQDDNDPELEIWHETDWGDIRVYNRSGVGQPMALSTVVNGHGLSTQIGYSPAPWLHTEVEGCATPTQMQVNEKGRLLRCLHNERQLAHSLIESGGENGRRVRTYEYLDGSYDSISGRFLGFNRVIEREQLNSPEFPGESSEVVRVRAFEDPDSFPEPTRIGPSLARRPNYELTVYIDDRGEDAGQNNDRVELVDHLWGLDAYGRRFVEVERHEQVFELGHGDDQSTFRVPRETNR